MASIEAHVIGMRIMCLCSDKKYRDVPLNPQLMQSVLNLIKHRQGGTLQLLPPSQEIGESDKLQCGRCAGLLLGDFSHKESQKFKCADQLPEPRETCILDCDSPTLPPSNQERMQCGCVQCRKDLVATLQL